MASLAVRIHTSLLGTPRLLQGICRRPGLILMLFLLGGLLALKFSPSSNEADRSPQSTSWDETHPPYWLTRKVEDPSDPGYWIPKLEGPDVQVRLDARSHLSQMRDRPVNHLRWVWRNGSPDARYEAVAALTLIDNGTWDLVATMPEYIRLLQDADPEVRVRAAERVGWIADPPSAFWKARAALTSARNDPSECVREAVQEALDGQVEYFKRRAASRLSETWDDIRRRWR
jgi:HEAT repeats